MTTSSSLADKHADYAPPAGTKEYEDWAAQDLRQTILAITWTFLALCNVFVALRLYVRIRVYRRLLSDDWWLVCGVLAGYVSAVLTTVAVSNGNGRHMPVLSESESQNVILFTLLAFCPGILFFGLPKLAVLKLLVRLLTPAKWLRMFFWVIVWISQLSFICLIGLIIGQCNPPKRMWNKNTPGKCLDMDIVTDFAVYAGAMSAFVDVVLAFYPAVVLCRSPMSLRRRVSLTATLGFGAIGGAIAIYKTFLIPDGLGHPDFSYHSAKIIIWTAIEGGTVIMAASIPVFAPLVDMMIKGRNPFKRSEKNVGTYMPTNTQKEALEMSTRGYTSADSTERGRNNFSDSQVDILRFNRDTRGTPIPGPGQIICTNEVSVTYEARQVIDPLEAMIRGYNTANWKGW